MQPVDSSAGAVRSSFVQGRGTTQYLGSPSLPPPVSPLVTSDVLAEKSAMHHPCLRITHCMDTIYMQCANRILCATYCITLPSVCGAGEWVNNYTGQGSLLLRLIARWTIIQDWAHARPARMGTIIRSEYRRRWRGERLYRDVDNYTIIQGRCCCGQTTRVESCVKMVLSAWCCSMPVECCWSAGGHSQMMASDSYRVLLTLSHTIGKFHANEVRGGNTSSVRET